MTAEVIDFLREKARREGELYMAPERLREVNKRIGYDFRNRPNIDEVERLRKQAEDLIKMVDGTYEGSEDEIREILKPYIFEHMPEPLGFREMQRLSQLNPQTDYELNISSWDIK